METKMVYNITWDLFQTIMNELGNEEGSAFLKIVLSEVLKSRKEQENE